MSPELALAAACAIWPPSPRRSRAVVHAAARPIDWDRFVRDVERHRVISLAHDALAHVGIPQSARDALTRARRAVSRRNLLLAAETIRIQRLLDDARLAAVFLKGASLAMLAYGDVGLRMTGDIDVLVAREDVGRAVQCLRAAGYLAPRNLDSTFDEVLERRKDLALFHPAARVTVELHWLLFPHAEAMESVPPPETWRRVYVAPGAAVATFGEAHLFVYLCLHGAGHGWERLQWLADIAALLDGIPPERLEALLETADSAGGRHAACQAIALCASVLGTPVPAKLAVKLRTSVRTRVLCALALRTLGAERSATRRGVLFTACLLVSRLLLMQSWGSLVRELRHQWIFPADMQAVPLPRTLRFLYPLLRLPLWVWRRVRRDVRAGAA